MPRPDPVLTFHSGLEPRVVDAPPLPAVTGRGMFGLVLLAAFLVFHPGVSSAAEARLILDFQDAAPVLRVFGDDDDEWRFQSTPDLSAWTDLPRLGAVFSHPDNPPSVGLADTDSARAFYRAIRTSGLYDPAVMRTVSLTFAQANWQTLLASGRTTGSNIVGDLVLDGVVARTGIGARYRGNTSYTGMGAGGAPVKKSVNLQVDFVDPESRLMSYENLNLNNAYGDETIMREPLYFTVMQRYAPCPKAGFAKLYINDAYWGVYSLTQQEDGDLINEWFPSNDGDRWSAPNMPGGTGGGPGGGGGGFSGSGSALSYLGTNVATYRSNYELKKSDNATNAWLRLVHACEVLNNTPAAGLRDAVEGVLAVDSWLWFLAVENLFADDDSYWNKGADYGFYYEPESGRIHPVEHDGNEAFTSGDVSLSPVQGSTGTNRPVIRQLLSVPELRQRYLAHLRTVLHESFHPARLTPVIDQFHTLTVADIAADPKKGFTMAAYTNDLRALKTFVTNRFKYLTNHAELRPLAPDIVVVHGPDPTPTAAQTPSITAEVKATDPDGVDSVWLYHRTHAYGRFAAVPMFDDGAHGDAAGGDGIFGASITNYPAGTKVRFYVEARSANVARAARFSPARPELDAYRYQVETTTTTSTRVVINELMAANGRSFADPQGEFDDWIELRNLTDQPVDLAGMYLSDNPQNPRKWAFPEGTILAGNGYLIIWADEDGAAGTGLHANFKLSAEGEQVLLVDTDRNLNGLLDLVTFGPQEADRSYGRRPDDSTVFEIMIPTPGRANTSN